MKNWYQYHKKLDELFSEVDAETGVVPDDFEERLLLLEMDRTQMLVETALYVRQLEADAEIYKKQEDYFAKKRISTTKTIERMQEFLKNVVKNTGPVEDPDKRIKLSIKPSSFVNVDSVENAYDLMDELGKNYGDAVYETEPEVKYDKNLIKKYIKTNPEAAAIFTKYGVKIDTRDNLQIK